MQELFLRIAGSNPIGQGLAGGVTIAFLNLLGALAVLVVRRPSERLLNVALGFSAGVMLAASFTSLIMPGIELGGVLPVLAGIVLGVLVLDRADRWIPHLHVAVTGRAWSNGSEAAAAEGVGPSRVAGVILFIVAITLHNMPEGLAVGVGFGSGDVGRALSLMWAIGLQNIPEGLAVSVSALQAGFGRRFYAAYTGIRAGLVEIPLAVLGAWAVSVAEPILPYAMGFAAGAMLFVISDEIIPETHARGHERLATFGTILGLIVMLYLDVTLG
ncbi:ZIP family metal transporter [Limnochorda pilosa]|uniref:Metal transporter family GufA protein n=1 Tax=Limnochorda pilosa TaxID=1555112 RepID=A0A0K2SPX5_LIMPI|nr:ZIP family metal transporter [Limnochorda pilosa]BAS29165.1 metal transporter family GufA protein [Limnochorda pilosa]